MRIEVCLLALLEEAFLSVLFCQIKIHQDRKVIRIVMAFDQRAEDSDFFHLYLFIRENIIDPLSPLRIHFEGIE